MDQRSIEEFGLRVCERLWAATTGDSEQVFLMMPVKRSDAIRVSEQESKILLCQVLNENGLYHSIETPTRQQYRQTGTRAMSGRIDVTVYAGPLARERVLNVELKANLPSVESFRKDFEKLAREHVPGLWIHTLTTARRSTISTLFTKMRDAMQLVESHTINAKHGITFVVCVLDQGVALSAHLDLGVGIASAADSLFAGNTERWTATGPGAHNFFTFAKPAVEATRDSADASVHSDGAGPKKLLIYCPRITTETLLHFSQKGDSYRLRAFSGTLADKQPWVQPETTSARKFLAMNAPEVRIYIPGKTPTLDKLEEWKPIVEKFNRLHGIGA